MSQSTRTYLETAEEIRRRERARDKDVEELKKILGEIKEHGGNPQLQNMAKKLRESISKQERDISALYADEARLSRQLYTPNNYDTNSRSVRATGTTDGSSQSRSLSRRNSAAGKKAESQLNAELRRLLQLPDRSNEQNKQLIKQLAKEIDSLSKGRAANRELLAELTEYSSKEFAELKRVQDKDRKAGDRLRASVESNNHQWNKDLKTFKADIMVTLNTLNEQVNEIENTTRSIKSRVEHNRETLHQLEMAAKAWSGYRTRDAGLTAANLMISGVKTLWYATTPLFLMTKAVLDLVLPRSLTVRIHNRPINAQHQ